MIQSQPDEFLEESQSQYTGNQRFVALFLYFLEIHMQGILVQW